MKQWGAKISYHSYLCHQTSAVYQVLSTLRGMNMSDDKIKRFSLFSRTLSLSVCAGWLEICCVRTCRRRLAAARRIYQRHHPLTCTTISWPWDLLTSAQRRLRLHSAASEPQPRLLVTTTPNDPYSAPTAGMRLQPSCPLTPTVVIWVQPSSVIFDIRALWRSRLSVRVPGCQKLQMSA